MWQAIKDILSVADIRRKLLFTLGILALYRFIAYVPVAGVDTAQIAAFFRSSELLGLIDVFSGGTLVNFSVIALGIGPYISASIIFQLMTMVVPALEQLSKEGEQGRKQINQYTRLATLPLSLIQSIAVISILKSQGIIGAQSPLEFVAMMLTMMAGTMVVIWLGELISEFGVGNGISVIIFAAIVARMPLVFFQTVTTSVGGDILQILAFALIGLMVVASVVFVNEALRRIPVKYARRVRGVEYGNQTSFLPLKVNQAGMIPIIFAVSLVLMPSLAASVMAGSGNPDLVTLGLNINRWFNTGGLLYNLLYFVLVMGFTFFYTSIVFNPDKIADSIKKNGGFVPGIRPGRPTADYLNYVLVRITVFGAVFLGMVAVLPAFVQMFTNVGNLSLSGAGILIVVAVVLETVKQLEGRLVMRNYEGFIDK